MRKAKMYHILNKTWFVNVTENVGCFPQWLYFPALLERAVTSMFNSVSAASRREI